MQALGTRLTEALIERSYGSGMVVLPRLRIDLALAQSGRAGAQAAFAYDDAGLALWHPASSRAGYVLRNATTPALWLAHQGTIAHVAGSDHDFLLFDYPLSGTFEFSVEGYVGRFVESGITHNGLVLGPFGFNSGGSVFPVGQSETIGAPGRFTRFLRLNRLTIAATPQKVRYLVNGHLFYEDDDPSTTSPWLGLFATRTSLTTWRSVALTGQPEIPREVRLCQGDRLEGWISGLYGESQPPRRTEESIDQWGNVSRMSAAVIARRGRQRGRPPAKSKPRAPLKLDDFDWAASDGVLHGRRVLPGEPRNNVNGTSAGAGNEAAQSLLYYFRPLRDRDVLTYEFLYEPGQAMVHPAVDRLAFLLEPAGVKVHWMTTQFDELSGLTADNAAEEPGNRRGAPTLPLKTGQWNTVKLALRAARLSIELNGQPIYERALESTLGRQFGLFHFKDQTAAQARNVVLRGEWPERLGKEQLSDLTVPDPAAHPSEGDRRARHDIVGESFFALEADDVVESARRLAPEERFSRLAEWVLPSPDHPVWRFEGDFAPSFPAPPLDVAKAAPAAINGSGNGSGRGVRLQTGGELRAPAIELVETAKTLGRLDDLAARVRGMTLATDERGKLALDGLIGIARGDDAATAKILAELTVLLSKQPPDGPQWTRWPEMCLAARAAARPALRKPGLALADAIALQVEKRKLTAAHKMAPEETWMHQVAHLRALFEVKALAVEAGSDEARPFGIDSDNRAWARVTQSRSGTRGAGFPIPHWSDRDNQLTHYPGHDRDLMYLTIPLRGEFQLDCELSSSTGHAIRVGYGGVAVGPKQDLKSLDRSQFGRPLGDVAINPPLDKLGDWYTFRLAVKGGRVTATINGRKVHDAPAAPESDPWVTVVSQGTEKGYGAQAHDHGKSRSAPKVEHLRDARSDRMVGG